MSGGRPQRTNEYTAEPVSDRYRQCLFDWLASHPPLWNQINYRRRQQYFSQEGDVWDAEYTDLYDDYAPILSKATCQQTARKNSEAWRSFFERLDQYYSDDPAVSEKPSPPGYWGNRKDGYDLHGLVCNDLSGTRRTSCLLGTSIRCTSVICRACWKRIGRPR